MHGGDGRGGGGAGAREPDSRDCGTRALEPGGGEGRRREAAESHQKGLLTHEEESGTFLREKRTSRSAVSKDHSGCCAEKRKAGRPAGPGPHDGEPWRWPRRSRTDGGSGQVRRVKLFPSRGRERRLQFRACCFVHTCEPARRLRGCHALGCGQQVDAETSVEERDAGASTNHGAQRRPPESLSDTYIPLKEPTQVDFRILSCEFWVPHFYSSLLHSLIDLTQRSGLKVRIIMYLWNSSSKPHKRDPEDLQAKWRLTASSAHQLEPQEGRKTGSPPQLLLRPTGPAA